MQQKNRHQLGREIGERLWGKHHFKQMEKFLSGFHPMLFEEYGLESWARYARPGPDLKTRSLCVIAAFTVIGYYDPLRDHIFGALNNGATQQEIEEVILMVGAYGGIPTVLGGLKVAKKAFADYKPSTDRP